MQYCLLTYLNIESLYLLLYFRITSARQHCHDIGLATYVVTLDDELFQLVTLILIWLYLGLKLRLDSIGLGLACQGLGLGTCWTRYRSGID